MRKFFYLIIAFLGLESCASGLGKATSNKETMNIDTATFNNIFSLYKEPTLKHRRFKHADVVNLINKHKEGNFLRISQIGESFQKRAIYELVYGQGDKTVMLWSQMHGDEPTATMALFDLFNFLEGKNDGYDSIRNLLKDSLNIHFIPMLNPDGAEMFTRRTAQGIDMNRDARVGHTVEGALLRQRAEVLKPQYGFNLHDQNIYYNVPGTKNPVSISLLAPAYNTEREINDVREGGMQLAVGMNKVLQQYIPNAVAKYDDTHTPRGFGDNFQSWGASTVLIESGGMKDDPEKQQIRKLNFIIILNGLIEIAEGSYKNYNKSDYEAIPFNASQLHDVVLRNVTISNDWGTYKTDVAIRRSEATVGGDYFVRGAVEDIGDLQESYGYDELDADGLIFVKAKVDESKISNLQDFSEEKSYDLLKKGWMAKRLASNKQNDSLFLHNYPIHLVLNKTFLPITDLALGVPANFYLADANGQLRYAVVNGYLIDLSKPLADKQFKNRVY